MSDQNVEFAVLGGGCFWCVEAVFRRAVTSGYSGGRTVNPTYYEVCSEKTGHAEVVQLEFDPRQVTFSEILEVFFATHDPTTLNRQGADRGARYRSVILYTTESQKDQATNFIKALDASGTEKGPVVTEVAPFEEFYPAEREHHLFYQNNSRKYVLPDSDQPQGCQGTAEVQLQASLVLAAALPGMVMLNEGEA